ncbi:MAG: DUF309 domain-containing protein [Acidobacteriota bacterium]
MPSASAVERGRALFNAGRYFDAHEVWEEVWLSETGERRRLLQGLIQIAAALHKAAGGGPASGCVRLLDAGLDKLDGQTGAPWRLALGRFRGDLRKLRTLAEAWRQERSGPPEAPFPKLRRSVPRPAREPG